MRIEVLALKNDHRAKAALRRLCFALPVSALIAGCSAAPATDSESDALHRGPRGGSSSGSSGSSSGTAVSTGALSHIFLTGGSNAGGSNVADTWIWDGTSWTQQTGSGPSPSSGEIGGLLGENIVFFSYGPNPTIGDPGQTWLWSLTTSKWTQSNVAEPALRFDAMGGTLGSRFVMYGGYDTGDNMWAWNGSQWTNTLPETDTTPDLPPDLGPASTVLDGKLLITNGPQIWTTDGSTFAPSQTFAGPHVRTGALAATLGETVVLFGGYDLTVGDPNDAPLRETWIWDGGSWTQDEGPQPPYELDLAPAGIVSVGGSVILIASTAASGTPVNQMWKWDGASWTQLSVKGPASFRSSATVVAF